MMDYVVYMVCTMMDPHFRTKIDFHLNLLRIYDAGFFSLDFSRKGDSKEKWRDAVAK